MTPTQIALVERLRAGGGALYQCECCTFAWGPGMASERVSASTVRSLERAKVIRLEGGRLPVARFTVV